MAQFKATVDILTTADSGRRDLSGLIWSVLHTTENSDNTPPDDVAKWQQDESNESSYNVLFGTDGRTVRSNDDDFSPWSSGMPGNRLGVHGSAIGYASRTRAQWLKYPKQLESIAQWLATNHREYKIPLRELTVDEVRRRIPGVTTHAVYWEAIGKAQGMDTRTDPGAGFPMDVVLKRAKELTSPKTPTPPKVKDNALTEKQYNELVKLLKLILDQLVGHPGLKFPGWSQLGGRSLVDAVAAIGEALEVEGMENDDSN